MATAETNINRSRQLSPIEMTLGEQFRGDVAQTLSNRIVSTISQRGLDIYDQYGQPVKGAIERLQPQVDQMTADASIRLDFNQRKYMGILVPKLVSALLGDPKDVSKVYEPSLTATVATSLDWFRNPDAVGETQFRVGFGGNEVVGSRGPAYLGPTLNTVEAVRKVYAEYTNWATLNTLYDKKGRGNQQEIDDAVKAALAKRLPPDASGTDRQNLLEEVQDSNRLTPEAVNEAITEAWGTLLKPLTREDREEIKEEYRISDKLPQIIVFNAGNAGKAINGMDPAQVDTARNINQDLITAVSQATHPEVAKNLKFQNDLPWNPNDFYTRMLVLYTRNLVSSLNGKHHQIDETLAQFGEHHQKTDNLVFGLTASEAYEGLHPLFFEEFLQGSDPSETLPRPAVMEPMPIPRHRRVDQARPEIRFGVARKYFQEHATVSDFINWLGSRYETATLKLDSATSQVQEQATALHSQAQQDYEAARTAPETNGKKKKNEPKVFKSSLGKAINDLDVSKDTKDRLREFLATDESFTTKRIKEATTIQEGDEKTVDQKVAELNTSQQKAWQEITDKLAKEKVSDSPWHIERLIYRLMEYQEKVGSLKKDVNLAVQRGDNEALRALLLMTPEPRDVHPAITLDFADAVDVTAITYPITSAEYVVNRGAQVPTYYVRKGSDTQLLPNPELPTQEKYEEAAKSATDAKKRISDTIQTADKKLKQPPVVTAETSASPLSSVDEAAGWFAQIDSLETSGDPAGAMDLLNAGIALTRQNLSAEQLKGILKSAAEIVLKIPVENVSQSEGVKSDYLSLLDDLDPNNREAAENRYHQIIIDVLAKHGVALAARRELVLA